MIVYGSGGSLIVEKDYPATGEGFRLLVQQCHGSAAPEALRHYQDIIMVPKNQTQVPHLPQIFFDMMVMSFGPIFTGRRMKSSCLLWDRGLRRLSLFGQHIRVLNNWETTTSPTKETTSESMSTQ